MIDGTFSDLARGLGAGRTWTFLEVEMIFSSDCHRPRGRETIRKLDFRSQLCTLGMVFPVLLPEASQILI